MLIDPKVIEERLKILIGMRATRIKRGANMLVFGFGPLVEIKSYKGENCLSPYFLLTRSVYGVFFLQMELFWDSEIFIIPPKS